MIPIRLSLSLLAMLLGVMSVSVKAIEPLPQPLSLSDALKISMDHPKLLLEQSYVDSSKATLNEISSEQDLDVTLQGYLSVIDPSDLSSDRSINDSKIKLLARKKLYDFGYSEARESSAKTHYEGKKWLFRHQLQQHRLSVMAAYFNVLIADKKNSWRKEQTTYAFFQYENNQDYLDLGKLSEIELLKSKNNYREQRLLRTQSEQEQRLTRFTLATLLNHPDESPSDLLMPKVIWNKKTPSVELVLTRIRSNNPALMAAEKSVESTKEQFQAMLHRDNPVLSGELSVADYRRRTGSTHPVSASLILEVPLYSGNKTQSIVAKARSEWVEKQALLTLLELSLQQKAEELLVKMDTAKAELDALQVSSDYGELYLDKNRALYELEVASDFGDAMVRVAKIDYQKVKAILAYALFDAQLKALQGELISLDEVK